MIGSMRWTLLWLAIALIFMGVGNGDDAGAIVGLHC
jgi:hypothetical protein